MNEEKPKVYLNLNRFFPVVYRSGLGAKKHNCSAQPVHVGNHEVIAAIRIVNICQHWTAKCS